MNRLFLLTVDGLSPRFLGPYGNSWVQTPVVDQFAAEAICFDRFFSASTNAWDTIDEIGRQFPGIQQGLLITDCDQLIARTDELIQDSLWIDPEHMLENESASNQLLAMAAEKIADLDPLPECVWVHLSSLTRTWDAPLEIQNSYKDENDPEPIRFEIAPTGILKPDFDPDRRLSIRHAYAAEIRNLDAALEPLFLAIEHQDPNATVLFCGTRGYGLGEHRWVGVETQLTDRPERDHESETSGDSESIENLNADSDRPEMDMEIPEDDFHYPTPFAEFLHCPLFIREPASGSISKRISKRIHQFCQPQDLSGLIFSTDPTGPNDEQDQNLPEFAVSQTREWKRVQTDAWSYMAKMDPSDSSQVDQEYLFAKPDDLLEVNEVSAICSEITRDFREWMTSLGPDLNSHNGRDLPESLKTRQ